MVLGKGRPGPLQIKFYTAYPGWDIKAVARWREGLLNFVFIHTYFAY